MARRLVFVVTGTIVALLTSGLQDCDGAEESIDFGRDIRPILADACFACHGPDENSREAGLRLDRRKNALAETDSGSTAVVPGDAEKSELIARITPADESMRMPPAESNKTLSAEQIKLLKRWIQQGAAWDQHWAFIPPHSPELPDAGDDSWPRNEIDRFILARLKREGLSPSAEADRITLLRRVTFDLTGLPPTAQEVTQFLQDTGPRAYERAVDRLLDSPHYGEHMARYWLDAARYGDTHGLHLDNYREIWPYRDWVVNAFDRNLPYDQFVIEQLAGDLLPDPTDNQLIATGFNRCHVTTNEGGSIDEEVYVRNVVDRVVTMGTVMMGMTLECTRCHDHKFDPLTMNDFYSLFGYFNSLDADPLDGNRQDHAPVLHVPTSEQRKAIEMIASDIRALHTRLAEPWPELDEKQKAWEAAEIRRMALPEPTESSPVVLGLWHVVGPFKDARRYLLSKKHGPEGREIDLEKTYHTSAGETLTWQVRPEWIDGKIHTDLAGKTAANFLVRTVHSREDRTIEVDIGSGDAILIYLNGTKVFTSDVTRDAAANQDKVRLSLKSGENTLLMKLINYDGQTGFYFKTDAPVAHMPHEIAEFVHVPPENRSESQQSILRQFYRLNVSGFAEIATLQEQLKSKREERSEIERNVATTLIWREKAEPLPAYLLERGEYTLKSDERPRATPSFLPGPPEGAPENRLGLAQWLVSPDHPLTSRVAVNRLWQQIFGTGLVKTSDDFGTRGERPSHPELLDWLAVQFVEDGWDVKAMMKRLVMSAAYRQSSHVTPDQLQRDPDNRLIARGPRLRLDAEMLRDQALAVSGLLVPKRGGRSVKPPQPDGLWFAVGYSGSNTVRFKADTEAQNIYRRTLYTFIKRTSPPPQMSTFDGPSRESCSVRRERTNTPLQALLLFNDPQFFSAAQALARRTIDEAEETAEDRARHMFRLCTCRGPTDQELDDLLNGFRIDLKHFEQDVDAARDVMGSDGQCDETAPVVAAWTMMANLLLNLDEVVTKN